MIGICYTKPSKQGIYVADALMEGFPNTCKITVDNYKRTIQKCTDFIQICYPNFYKMQKAPDKKWYKFYTAIPKERTLYVETGFIKSQVQYDMGLVSDLEQVYYAIGSGGVKNKANYNNHNSPQDRLKELDIEFGQQKNQDGVIVILGQAYRGISSQDININNWYIEVYNQLRESTRRTIVFKPHPKTVLDKKEWKIHKKFLSDYLPDLEIFCSPLNNVAAAVSYSSNATIDTLLAGIPTYTCSDINIAWPVTPHNISQIDKLEYPPQIYLQQFFQDLAYAQWSVSEIRSGRVSEHFMIPNMGSFIMPNIFS